MLAFVIILQVVVALFLILVVLLQPGNRGGASAAMGGAGSDTVFGGRGANTFLSKITFGAAVSFMVTNFLLAYMSSSSNESSALKALEKTEPVKTEQKATDDVGGEDAPAEKDSAPAHTPEDAKPAPDGKAKE